MFNVLIFIIGAGIMFYMGLRSVLQRRRLQQKGQRVEARVAGTVQSRDGAAYLLEFETEGGSHRLHYPKAAKGKGFASGETVTLYYDPEDPEKMYVEGDRSVLEHIGMPQPGDCRVVFSASAEELEAAIQAEQAAENPPQTEEDLLTAAVNRAILTGFSTLYQELVEKEHLVPVTDPDFELRRQAELLIPAITGYESDMVRIELKRYMRQFRRRDLLRFLDSEIGQPSMLDEFRPNKAGGYSKYVGPALTYQVFSSNVPGIPVWSMAMTLLVKGAILGKSSFSEPVMPAFFARSIAMVNSDLADAIAVVPWKGGSQQLEDSAIDAAAAVIVYGSSQTTKLIAGKVAGSKPCLGYGAKVGLAFIGREALRPDTYADTVHRVAVDIATYDQQSCLAPQTVFVETDGALTPREVAQLLGGELENQQRKYPRSVLSDAENVAIQRARTDAEMRALMGGKAAVFASGHSTAWSVLYRELDGSGADEDVASLMSPLNRTVNVVAVPDLLDAARRLTSCRGWLQSCGVAVDSTRLFGLADTLAEVGVNRICPLGEMDRAKSGWHHDGGFNLIDLLRAVDVERGSDAYSDSFDMDME